MSDDRPEEIPGAILSMPDFGPAKPPPDDLITLLQALAKAPTGITEAHAAIFKGACQSAAEALQALADKLVAERHRHEDEITQLTISYGALYSAFQEMCIITSGSLSAIQAACRAGNAYLRQNVEERHKLSQARDAKPVT